MSTIRTDSEASQQREHDACALILSVRKHGESTYGTLKRAMNALARMGHRTGFVEGEGDGAGVQTDIPRQIWNGRLSRAGLRSSLATHPGFWVGHCFIDPAANLDSIRDALSLHFNQAGLNLLMDFTGDVRLEALGQQGRATAPVFMQLAGVVDDPEGLAARLLQVQTTLETTLPVHFASLSSDTVVYKVRGSVEALPRFYHDLQDRNFSTAMALCHARYSTNTGSSFARVQPFALIGHNGEINTISRFRQEAKQIGAILDPLNSDSQDIDRTLHTLCVDYGMTIVEAMELIFPPVPHEMAQLPEALRAVYSRMRYAFGPYAQGPAAVVARYRDLALVSVDALGLRPLWFVDTEKEYIFSSERGVVPFENMNTDPRPLAPGEKMAVRVTRGDKVEVFNHADIRQHVMKRAFEREAPDYAQHYWAGWGPRVVVDRYPRPDGGSHLQPHTQTEVALMTSQQVAVLLAPTPLPWQAAARQVDSVVLAAAGWNREHLQEIKAIVETGKDLVGSLGHDGPLAVLSANRVNLADYFKETVAVVTNPSIDREREAEAFSTKVMVGTRPTIPYSMHNGHGLIELETPLLAGGHPDLGDAITGQGIAEALGTLAIEDLLSRFEPDIAILAMGVADGETVDAALDRLAEAALAATFDGARCLILDDTDLLTQGMGWLDPHLAVAAVDRHLREAGMRRQVGLVLRSAGLRSLHDVVLASGFGADAVNPYAMLAVAIGADAKATMNTDLEAIIRAQRQVLKNLTAGLEKVISTIGCHELRGYGRVFSSIGLAPSVADRLNTPNYFGNEQVGLTWNRLNQEADERRAELRGEAPARLAKVDRFYPKFWKKAEAVAHGEMSMDEFIEAYRSLKETVPVALRHVLDFKLGEAAIDPAEVDLGVDRHDLPLLISAMSFGSQGELAYRAYAEAAARLNMVCVNGEGGELPDVMGVYQHNRGQQVASGRFGVNAQFLNSAYVLEIKVGQGAKPGEGGMLPAAKVTPQVARARRTTPNVALISPSNNHDIYSIEDLAQLIEELKTVNPEARIAVKIPVVPGVGLIAVGVAKAGADVITLTGYDGATGAARRHALQYVGLPTEIGVYEAHHALTEAGLRRRVELWCDGGMKTGSDAMKMILLGANRVGFATMAMVAMGCTICRKCHEGTCHVGITTHITSIEEADNLGLKSFVPREYDRAVEGIVRVFGVIAEEMRRITAQLGASRVQDLVGRSDLLQQVAAHEQIDLTPMLTAVAPVAERGVVYGGRRLTRPRNILTKMITDVIRETVRDDEREATYYDEVMAYDRALGSHLAGAMVREPEFYDNMDSVHLHFGPSSVAGNGFAAWVIDKQDIVIEGGAQDGAAKSANGGRVAIMKGLNHRGQRIDGSVGKSFAYGAQRGVFIVQGNADSRACIRLSGADVVFGGEITQRVDESAETSMGTYANLKGFACEYMTSGRVLIMGDPGPYAFAGMTGGVVYQKLTPAYGFDRAALQRRIARGAKVDIRAIEADDVASIQALLGYYIEALELTDQFETAQQMRNLAAPYTLTQNFVKVAPA